MIDLPSLALFSGTRNKFLREGSHAIWSVLYATASCQMLAISSRYLVNISAICCQYLCNILEISWPFDVYLFVCKLSTISTEYFSNILAISQYTVLSQQNWTNALSKTPPMSYKAIFKQFFKLWHHRNVILFLSLWLRLIIQPQLTSIT